jgi:NADH-quinone oxidoreductase subunit K
MMAAPNESGMLLAAILFAIGLIGVLIRRNLLFILLSIEVMLNACALAFVAADSHVQRRPDGQVMVFFIMAMAAAEVAVALALVLHLWRTAHTLDTRAIMRMRG